MANARCPRLLALAAGCLLLAALPLRADGVEVGRAGGAGSTAAVSVTIPELTGVSLKAGAESGRVAIALFRTTGVVVVRDAPESRTDWRFARVSLRVRDDTAAVLNLKSGGWKTITDTIPAAFHRASTRGDAAGGGEVTYEIWSF